MPSINIKKIKRVFVRQYGVNWRKIRTIKACIELNWKSMIRVGFEQILKDPIGAIKVLMLIHQVNKQVQWYPERKQWRMVPPKWDSYRKIDVDKDKAIENLYKNRGLYNHL